MSCKVIKEDLLRNNTAATVGEVHTELHSFYFEELRHVDSDCSQQCREDVHDHPLAPALHLPVVVGSADSQEPLHPHSYYQVDTCTHTDSEIKTDKTSIILGSVFEVLAIIGLPTVEKLNKRKM